MNAPAGTRRNSRPTPDAVRFFATPAKWRQWLDRNHAKADEIWVGFYKKGSGKPSITWPESVDEALCYGWIDGIRKSIDDVSYKIRFTPRRKGSIWSAVNIARVDVLTTEGRMMPAGAAAFAAREDKKSRVYTYEQNDVLPLDKTIEKRFKANKKAWNFFQGQAPYYRKLMTRWLNSAKAEETRLRRLAKLVAACDQGKRM